MTDRDQVDAPTDEVPTFADVQNVRAEEREMAERAWAVADQVPRQMRRVAREAGHKAGQAEGRKFGIIGLLVALLVSVLAGVASAAAYATSIDTRSDLVTIQAALDKLDTANLALTARGQEPVPPPPASDPTGAVAAAVLAQVLASLPPSPSADEVASRLQTTVTANVLGPTLDELTGQVSSYFALHPPQPGPPPSEASIRAAVDAALAQNPPPAGPPGQDGQPPPCLAEPTQCRGADGQDGADSTVPGPPGRDGVMCPTGFTPQERMVITSDGPEDTVLCIRDEEDR